jgi:hypothetical protein
VRDKAHVRFVSKQPCLVCGRQPADAHHLRFAQSAALGRKVSDEFTVPLCRVHHRELHRCGDEVEWWSKCAVDPLGMASVLWAQTHPPRPGIEPPRTAVGGEPDMIDPFVTNSSTGAAPRQPKRSSNYKTNRIVEGGHDLIATDRG